MTDVATRARVLMLATTSIERDAAIDAVGARTERMPQSSVHTELTMHALGKIGGSDILLAQVDEAGASGEADMAEIASTAIRYGRPDYVIVVGTCHGLRPGGGQRIGDVLVSERVASLHHRQQADRSGGAQVLSREVDARASALLVERCHAAQDGWSRYRAGIHFGLMVCSGSPVDSDIDLDELGTRHPDAMGAEAGGIGVLDAVVRSTLDWIMVKAIAGWGSGKPDASLDIAARNAVDFVTHVVAVGALRRP